MATKRSKPVRVFRRIITNNLGLKLFSLFAAVLLFSLVRGTEDGKISVFVDVILRLPESSSSKMLVSEVPDRVKLTLRGSRSLLETIKKEGLPAVEIDLRDTSRSYYYFDPEAFDVPAAVDLVRLQPNSIELRWAKRIERRLPIEARLAGTPGEGLQATVARLDPATVHVSGPETDVASLDRVPTEPVEVEGLGVGEYRQRVPLVPPRSHTEFAPDTVVVVVEVSRIEGKRVLSEVPVHAVGASEVELHPARVDIVLRGPSHVLEALEMGDVQPTVELGGFELEGADRNVEVKVEVVGVPEELQSVVTPSSVRASAPVGGAADPVRDTTSPR